MSRMAGETAVKSDFVPVSGEVTTTTRIDINGLIAETTDRIDYTDSAFEARVRAPGAISRFSRP